MLHGEAIALGMVLEAMLAEQLGVAEPGTSDQLLEATGGAGFEGNHVVDVPAMMSLLHADKKSRAGVVEFALPKRIGMMAGAGKGWTVPVPDDAIRALWSVG
jgi:3-dehydroquinate synthetase